MKKIIFVLALVLGTAICAGAQDVITTVKGEKIKAKVTEVGPEVVKYKRIDNPNGPIYAAPVSDILSITYEGGAVEYYNEPDKVGVPAPAPEAIPMPDPERRVPGPRMQDPGNVRYKDIAGLYDTRYYRERAGDPYIPVLSGIASFFLPGLGQCIDGEWGRGLGIAAANVGFFLLEITEASAIAYNVAKSGYYYMNSYPYYYSDYGDLACFSGGALALTLLAQAGLNIWNICDAVKIAKVKNMYYNDFCSGRASFDMQFAPTLAFVPSAGNTFTPAAGLSLKVSF